MPEKPALAAFQYDEETATFSCKGSWTVLCLDGLPEQIKKMTFKSATSLTIDGKHIQRLDSAGALALQNFLQHLQAKTKVEVKLIQFSEEQEALMHLISEKQEFINFHSEPEPKKNLFYRIGVEAEHKQKQVQGFLGIVGEICVDFVQSLRQLKGFQFPSIVSIIQTAGLQALPIVALLSFLIGVVLAYQMGLQLKTYGANIFIAYLSGMAIFREFAPLITAIIVAGRTSSAFTAQIGSMKINEEIDAIATMGLSPTQLLVLPKVIGLLIAFPLLIFWSDIFNILGAMFMSKWMLNIGYFDYLSRLKTDVGFQQLMLGLYKAPFFAFVIALVGCFQGFSVSGNADNLGHQTTKSVVQALFLIIVVDAIFSVIYSWLGV